MRAERNNVDADSATRGSGNDDGSVGMPRGLEDALQLVSRRPGLLQRAPTQTLRVSTTCGPRRLAPTAAKGGNIWRNSPTKSLLGIFFEGCWLWAPLQKHAGTRDTSLSFPPPPPVPLRQSASGAGAVPAAGVGMLMRRESAHASCGFFLRGRLRVVFPRVAVVHAGVFDVQCVLTLRRRTR